MDEAVKAGQVWARKNTGRELRIERPIKGTHRMWHEARDLSTGKVAEVSEVMLFSDFVLVKDAP